MLANSPSNVNKYNLFVKYYPILLIYTSLFLGHMQEKIFNGQAYQQTFVWKCQSPFSFFFSFFIHMCACRHPQVYTHTHTVVSHLQSSSCRAVAEVATADTPHALAPASQWEQPDLRRFLLSLYAIVPSFPYLRCRRRARSFSSSVHTLSLSVLTLSISCLTTHSCRSRALVLEQREKSEEGYYEGGIMEQWAFTGHRNYDTFSMEQYFLCGNISHVDCSNIKVFFSPSIKVQWHWSGPAAEQEGLCCASCVY